RCVFEIYEEALAKYENARRAWEARHKDVQRSEQRRRYSACARRRCPRLTRPNGDRAPLGAVAYRIRLSRTGRMPTRAQEVRYAIPDLLAQIQRDIATADSERASVDRIGIPVDCDEIESERSRMSCR